MPKDRKVLNVFISQPMHGRDKKDILEERKEIMQLLGECNPYKKTWDLHIIDNLHHENVKTWDYFPPERAGRLWNLGQSISKMCDADLLVFAPGYTHAQGCFIESFVTAVYGIPTCIVGDQTNEYIKRKLMIAMRDKNKWRYKNG